MQKLFVVTTTTGKKLDVKKHVQVAGCRVIDGELDSSKIYRVIRGDQCIAEGLKIDSLKKFTKDVTKVESGMECGLSFSQHDI